jgi:hypothetical protein
VPLLDGVTAPARGANRALKCTNEPDGHFFGPENGSETMEIGEFAINLK